MKTLKIMKSSRISKNSSAKKIEKPEAVLTAEVINLELNILQDP